MRFFLAALLAASIAAIASNQVATAIDPVETAGVARIDTPKGEVFLSLDADGRAVVTTGQLAQEQERGTFSRHTTVDRSARLAALHEINKPPPAPPAPLVEVYVSQTQSITLHDGHRRGRGVGRDGYRRGDHLRRLPTLRSDGNTYRERAER